VVEYAQMNQDGKELTQLGQEVYKQLERVFENANEIDKPGVTKQQSKKILVTESQEAKQKYLDFLSQLNKMLESLAKRLKDDN